LNKKNGKKKKSEHKVSEIESRRLCVIAEGFSQPKRKILRAFKNLKKQHGTVTLANLCSRLKKDSVPFATLKSKMLDWITKYNIFERTEGTNGTVYLTKTKKKRPEKTKNMEVEADDRVNSEEISESDEEIFDIFS
jgi:hypothetical protein